LGIVHTAKGDKTYANINSIMALPKGMACEELRNPAVKFDIGTFDKKVFEALPEFLRKKILMSKELEEGGIPEETQVSAAVEEDADIPF
jgi:hypothetical protein